MRVLVEPIEFRAKGARTPQPRAERSAALGLGVPHKRRRAESAQRGAVSRFQRSKSFRGDRVSQGVAAGLMSGGTFGANVRKKIIQESPNQPEFFGVDRWNGRK